MLNEALKKAKKDEEKKVSINFQVPSSLKEEFDKLCRDNEVSLTAMLNSLMEVTIEESKGLGTSELEFAKHLLAEAKSWMYHKVHQDDNFYDYIDGMPEEQRELYEARLKVEVDLYKNVCKFLGDKE
ncbi:hypothetical protein [Sulfurimonas sp.]|uniref:hypothetical protein n=1 Tax=Sulfurimonas sp. TaxID=2022749 RepID=UPI003D107777